MQMDAVNVLLGVVTIILIPLLAWLGSRQLRRIEEDEVVGRTAATSELKSVAATIMARAEESHVLGIRALERVNEVKDALSAHRLHVAETYTSLKRFEGFEAALFKKLDAIESKLDGKADKGGDD